MSVDLSKLNRPGTAASFGTRSKGKLPTSRQATVNLLNSSTANKTTVFSLDSKSKNNWVQGQSVSRDHSKYDFQGIRGRNKKGSGYQVRRTSVAASSRVATNTNLNIDNNNAFSTGQMAAGGILGTVGLLNKLGVFGSKGTSAAAPTNTQRLDAALGGLSSASSLTSSSASSFVSSMTSAKDSATLRSAIAEANTKKSELSTIVGTEAQFKAKQTEMKNNIKTLEGEVKTAEKNVEDKTQAVSTSEQKVKTLTTQRDVKKGALTNAMTKKNQCSKAYADAHANTVSAQASFDRANDALRDAKPTDPGYVMLQNAKQQAEIALKNAKEAEEKAKTALDKANEDVVNADKDVKEAEKDLQTAQKNLDAAKDEQTKAKEDLDKANKELDTKKAELQKQNDELDKLEQAKEDLDKLSAEIPKQEARLKELEQKEQDEFNELSDKIDSKVEDVNNRSKKIDASDGMSIAERIRQRRNERADSKIDSMSEQKNALADNVAKTNILRDNSNVIMGADNQELRSGDLPSGKKVYFIGTKEVSQAEYDAAVKGAQA